MKNQIAAHLVPYLNKLTKPTEVQFAFKTAFLSIACAVDFKEIINVYQNAHILSEQLDELLLQDPAVSLLDINPRNKERICPQKVIDKNV